MTHYPDDPNEVQAANPTAGKGLLFFLLVTAIGSALAVFVLTQRSANGPLVPTEVPSPLTVPVVQVTLQESFVIDEQFTGLVTARRSSRLGFTGGGRVDGLYADVGDRVDKGALMAKLDTRALSAQLSSAEAVVAEAQAAYELARSTVDRQRVLAAKGHVSQQRVDEAEAQANIAMARINAAEANADALRVQISLARIQAPFAGVITARMVDEGAIAAPSQAIFELVESGALEARIGLSADLAKTLSVGEAYALKAGDRRLTGVLRAKTGVVDAGLRTVTTIFDLPEEINIAAGEVVRLALKQTLEERGVWIPVSALTESERGLWSVYVVRGAGDDARARPDAVELIHTDGARAYARGALRDGDLVISDGLQRLAPGQLVTPREQTLAASATSGG